MFPKWRPAAWPGARLREALFGVAGKSWFGSCIELGSSGSGFQVPPGPSAGRGDEAPPGLLSPGRGRPDCERPSNDEGPGLGVLTCSPDPRMRSKAHRHGTLGAFLVSVAILIPGTGWTQDRSYKQWGPLTLGGEVAASIAPEDPAYLNDTGYSSNPLRRLSLSLSASLALARPAALLVEARTDDLQAPRLYALYLRLKPWAARSVDAQIGLIPPVFGAFARRPYGSGNPLVGYPLAYQYLTTMRTDAVPASADDLLRARGFGGYVRYPVGNPYGGPGLPVVDGQRWDTGVEVRVGREPVQLAAAITQGSLSYPRVQDNNAGKQVSARLQGTPVTGLVLGLSVAAGPYADRTLDSALPPEEAGRTRRQRAAGFDLEYSRGHATLRAEAIWTDWDLPAIDAPRIEDPVGARALCLEATYRVAPGLDLVARYDRLGFTEVQGSTRRDSWDARVTRVEGGLVYALRRGLWVKAVYQQNWRSAGPRGRRGFPAAQLLWQF